MTQRQTRRGWVTVGPGGLLFVLVLVMVTSAAIYTQANLLFGAVGLLCGAGLISLLWSVATLRRIEVERELPARGVAEQPMILRYRVINRGWLPAFGLVIREQLATPPEHDNAHAGAEPDTERPGTRKPRAPRKRRSRRARTRGPGDARGPAPLAVGPETWVVHAGPGQAVRTAAECWPRARGSVRFTHIRVSASFPFGIVQRVFVDPRPAELLVYPPIRRLRRQAFATLTRGEAPGRRQINRGGGSDEFYSLREYRAGDGMRTIDWRRSAKVGKPVTREMTRPSPPRIMILLDLSAATAATRSASPSANPSASPPGGPAPRPRPWFLVVWWRRYRRSDPQPTTRPDPVEAAIALAASVISDAQDRGYWVGLSVRGAACERFPVHHGRPHRLRMLDALAALDPARPEAPDQAARVRPTVIIHTGGGPPPARPTAPAAPTLMPAGYDGYYLDTPAPSPSDLSPLDRHDDPQPARPPLPEPLAVS